MNVQPFSPSLGNTKNLGATAAASSVTLAPIDTNTGSLGQGNNVFRIVNSGPNAVFLRWGTAAQIAATPASVTADLAMLAGTVEVFTKSPDVTTVSAICAATQTATIFITCGEGL